MKTRLEIKLSCGAELIAHRTHRSWAIRWTECYSSEVRYVEVRPDSLAELNKLFRLMQANTPAPRKGST